MSVRTKTAHVLPLLLLLAAACAQDTTTETSSPASSNADGADLVIDVRDNEFTPATAEVAVGDTVAWDFTTADTPHDVAFDGGPASDVLDDGTWSTTLDEPGTHVYECTLHRGMTGEIIVTD